MNSMNSNISLKHANSFDFEGFKAKALVMLHPFAYL